MYYEEAEFCVRVRRARYRVVYVPGAIANHDERQSLSGNESLRYLWRYHRARYLYAVRNLASPEDRRRFTVEERRWLKQDIRDERYRLFLLACKLSLITRLARNLWLLA
jgi:GT2 family glycosyltransferase